MLSDIRNRLNPGIEFNIPPNGKGISLHNNTGSAVVIGEVVIINYEQVAGEEINAIAAATTTFVVRTAVAMEAIADGDIGYFQVEGLFETLVDGTADVASGNSLELVSGDIAFTYEVSARSQYGAAVAIDAITSATPALKTVFLTGEQHLLA